MKEKDINSLDHTTWRCQYHVVFAPKYRRMVIYREIKADIGKILRQLCQQKGIEIIEAEACPNHIHMLLSIPPKYSVSQIMGYLKGKSSLMIFDSVATGLVLPICMVRCISNGVLPRALVNWNGMIEFAVIA